MSQEQTSFPFALDEAFEWPFDFGTPMPATGEQTVNPLDLFVAPPDVLPAQRPLGTNTAAQQTEIPRADALPPVNPPAMSQARQGAVHDPMLPQMQHDLAAEQPENERALSLQEANSPANFPARQRADNYLVLHGQHQSAAGWQSGIDPTLTLKQANPPVTVSTRQGATHPGEQHQLLNNTAAPQPENMFRHLIPDNDAAFFSAPQTAAPSGPGPQLAPASRQEWARRSSEAKRLKQSKKLGPRGVKRGAEEVEGSEEDVAAAQPPAKSNRPGPHRAAGSQLPHGWCLKDHQRRCDAKREVCREDCPLKVHWPDLWEKKNRARKEFREGGWVGGLWWHLHENADNRKERRKGKWIPDT